MIIRSIIILLVASLFAGCTSGEKKSVELLDLAGFEEKQNNTGHAIKLYEEILQKYPGTPAAATATARLSNLKNRTP